MGIELLENQDQMKKLHFLLVAFLIINLSGKISFSQSDKVVKKNIEIGKTDNQTMDHLDILCNRFGGRLVGSDAYENAAEWAAYKFKEWGMEVEMDEGGELPVGFNRGPWFGRLLAVEYKQGDFIAFDNVTGKISSIGLVSTKVDNGEAEVFIPNYELARKIVTRRKK